MATWNAALIGCGEIGTEHAAAIAQLDGLRFTAYCDIHEDRARRFLDTYGGDYATADAARVFADDGIDVVYICTQHDSHVDLCLQAARAGKHALVEKPLALTREGCEQVASAVQDSGITMMMGFKLRFFELVNKARELVPDPILATMQMMNDRAPEDRWVMDPIRGGGAILSAGVHSCDLLRHVLGSDPVSVSAAGENYYHRNGIIDNMAAIYRFASGAVGNLIHGDCKTPSHVSTFYLQMFAENRSVTLSRRLCHLVYEEAGAEPVVIDGTETGILEESRAFVAALDAGTPAPITHRDGTFATTMVLQAFEACRTQTTQPVAELVGG